MNKILEKLLTLTAILAGLLLFFITFSIGYAILTRAVRLPSPVWVTQFNEYALLWITFLGTAWVLARGKHVSVDLLTGQLNHGAKKYFRLVHSIIGTAVCGILLWYSCSVTWGQFQRGVTDVQAVDVPKYLVLVVIPIGFFLLVLQFIRQFLIVIKDIPKDSNHRTGEAGQSISLGQSDCEKIVRKG